MLEIDIAPQNSQTDVTVTVKYDPEYTSGLESLVLEDDQGNTIYDASGDLPVSDVAGVYYLNGVEFNSAVSDNQQVSFSYSISNGPSASGDSGTLAEISGTPNLELATLDYTLTIFPQSGTTYNLSFLIGGQN